MAGFAKERLGRLHDGLAAYVARKEMPGLVALVASHGEERLETIGHLAFGSSVPMSERTIFRIASMTKPIMAVAAMILVEECRLRLDDPVEPWLPELGNRRVLRSVDASLDDTVPAYRSITLRDLLTYTMGLGLLMLPPGVAPLQQKLGDPRLGQGIPAPRAVVAPDEWMRLLGELPLVHQPGARWMYNTSADVLGVLVARAAGKTLDAFVRERVTDPLGMKDTAFFVPDSKVERLAESYVLHDGALALYDAARGGQWNTPPAFCAGSSGLVSTAMDLHAFSTMMLRGGSYGNTRILSRASVETMTRDQLTAAQKAGAGLSESFFEGHGWGFGMSVVTRRTDVACSVGTFGWDGGLGTSWTMDPAEEMVTLLLTQRAWASPMKPPVTRDFQTLAYAAL